MNDTLPSYLDQSPEIQERFKKLYESQKILEVKDLKKDFKCSKGLVTALDDLSFDVHRREFICVLGASGCGKSTLIRILAGLETPSSGQVLLDGKQVTGPGPDRGMVFQSYTLFPWLTVKQNVMFGLLENGSSKTTAESEALQWIELIGLAGFECHYPHQLSGGMKQRVAIARALANQPRILLMDEPFGALDAQTRSKMQRYLLQLWQHIDLTILFITHDLDEAILLADRILVLKPSPKSLAEMIEVPVPHPRTSNQINCPEFRATKARLEELIHGDGDEENFELPLEKIRLTRAGDDVI